MPHPFATILGAASTTVLAAAMREANLPLFFLAFGAFCFVLAAMVSETSLPGRLLPLFCIVPGAILLAGFASIHGFHVADVGLVSLLVLGVAYLSLGMALWVRTRYS